MLNSIKCVVHCIKFDRISCIFVRWIALFGFDELYLEHVLARDCMMRKTFCCHSVDNFSIFTGTSVQEAAVFVRFPRKSLC